MRSLFQLLPFANAVVLDEAGGAYPSQVAAWSAGELSLGADGSTATHFLYVLDGSTRVETASGDFELRAGMYASLPGVAKVRGDGRGFVVSRLGFHGLFALGGPAEETGRLRYIDGCTDSLLLAPVMRGDPCLNLLHIPPDTRQSSHTHPSIRVGVIADGTGTCVTPTARHLLAPGMLFFIPPHAEHAFHTADQALRVIAWHPDSDCGPTHEDHPMINRTLLT